MSHRFPAPVRLRPKVNLNGSLEHKRSVTQRFLAAQASADTENKLAPQAAAMIAARKAIDEKLVKKAEIKAELDLAQADLVAVIDQHDVSAREYVRAAAKLAAGDVARLTTLGVEVAAKAARGENDDVDAPAALTISSGPHPGEARVKCEKVEHAVAYVFEYKLEPSLPTDPWLPPGGIQTKRLSAVVTGLPPDQQIRARARAVGGTAGPWSEEAIGRAKASSK